MIDKIKIATELGMVDEGHDTIGHWFSFKGEEKRFLYPNVIEQAAEWVLSTYYSDHRKMESTVMSDGEMFRWIVAHNASIEREPAMKWTREDGTHFYCNFTLSAHNIQFGATETLAEGIMEADKVLKDIKGFK